MTLMILYYRREQLSICERTPAPKANDHLLPNVLAGLRAGIFQIVSKGSGAGWLVPRPDLSVPRKFDAKSGQAPLC